MKIYPKYLNFIINILFCGEVTSFSAGFQSLTLVYGTAELALAAETVLALLAVNAD